MIPLVELPQSDFNPLHHEGGDPAIIQNRNFPGISIHSTTRVETEYGIEGQEDCAISIHSTTRVETKRVSV